MTTQSKTFTRRENARRAAIAAGIPKDQIKITVHKTRDDVRFGFAATDPTRAAPVAVNTNAAVTKAKRAAGNHSERKPASQREERNGVKRPAAGGLCAAVWEYLDANPTSTAKQVRAAAEANGWNTNNAMCELYVWRKFQGISGRQAI